MCAWLELTAQRQKLGSRRYVLRNLMQAWESSYSNKKVSHGVFLCWHECVRGSNWQFSVIAWIQNVCCEKSSCKLRNPSLRKGLVWSIFCCYACILGSQDSTEDQWGLHKSILKRTRAPIGNRTKDSFRPQTLFLRIGTGAGSGAEGTRAGGALSRSTVHFGELMFWYLFISSVK